MAGQFALVSWSAQRLDAEWRAAATVAPAARVLAPLGLLDPNHESTMMDLLLVLCGGGVSDSLRTHGVVLTGRRVVLRPMTEDDWPVLLRWNQDPEVLYFSEGADVQTHTLEEVQAIYRGVSQRAFCFVAELTGLLRRGEPIGEGWLQEMNLPRLLDRFPGEGLWRIDLMIGEKGLWGGGLGTEIIGLLTQFAFERQESGLPADRVFGCDIADYNPRSRRAFEKNGYELFNCLPQPQGSKAQVVYDVMLTRGHYLRRTGRAG